MNTTRQLWKGGCDKKYEFTIYRVDTIFNAHQKGNYIFAKVVNDIW